MEIFKISQLAQKLHKNKLTEKRKAVYTGITWILFSITGTSFYIKAMADSTGGINAPTVAADIAVIVSSGLFVVGSYLLNKKGDNKSFVERFMIIGLSAGLILLLIALLLGFIYGAIYLSQNPGPLSEGAVIPYTWFDFAFFILLTVVYAYLLFKGMALSSGAKVRYLSR